MFILVVWIPLRITLHLTVLRSMVQQRRRETTDIPSTTFPFCPGRTMPDSELVFEENKRIFVQRRRESCHKV